MIWQLNNICKDNVYVIYRWDIFWSNEQGLYQFFTRKRERNCPRKSSSLKYCRTKKERNNFCLLIFTLLFYQMGNKCFPNDFQKFLCFLFIYLLIFFKAFLLTSSILSSPTQTYLWNLLDYYCLFIIFVGFLIFI